MTDLTKIQKPIGLLDEETRAELREVWEQGGMLQEYTGSGWADLADDRTHVDTRHTYRVKPEEPRPMTVDWSIFADNVRFIAADKDDVIYAFETRPEPGGEADHL